MTPFHWERCPVHPAGASTPPWEWAMGWWELVGLGVVCLNAGRYWCWGGVHVRGGDAMWAPAG